MSSDTGWSNVIHVTCSVCSFEQPPKRPGAWPRAAPLLITLFTSYVPPATYLGPTRFAQKSETGNIIHQMSIDSISYYVLNHTDLHLSHMIRKSEMSISITKCSFSQKPQASLASRRLYAALRFPMD